LVAAAQPGRGASAWSDQMLEVWCLLRARLDQDPIRRPLLPPFAFARVPSSEPSAL